MLSNSIILDLPNTYLMTYTLICVSNQVKLCSARHTICQSKSTKSVTTLIMWNNNDIQNNKNGLVHHSLKLPQWNASTVIGDKSDSMIQR